MLVDAGLSYRETRRRCADAGLDVRDVTDVLLTHEHADHTHGIDDLRALFIARRRRIPIYLDERASQTMRARSGSPPDHFFYFVLKHPELEPLHQVHLFARQLLELLRGER